VRVSVLIPTHRRPKLLKRALKSIVCQTHKDLEIIVYGDACGDKTRRVIDWFEDDRITYLSGNETIGECRARNLLVGKATAPVVAWQDDDDVSNIHRIEYQLRALEDNCAPFVRCGAKLLWEDTKYNPLESPKHQKCPKFVTPNTMTWTKHLRDNPYHEIMFGCDILWELEVIARYGIGVSVQRVLYYRDMMPHDRVTKVYQELDDFDEKMDWQRKKREELGDTISGIAPRWPKIDTVDISQ